MISNTCVFCFEFANASVVVWDAFWRCVLFLRPQEAETGFVPSVQDFDKKLAEADAYLQILIDQLKVGPDKYHCFIRNILHFHVGLKKSRISAPRFDVFH